MITTFKIFENQNFPKRGDYVIFNSSNKKFIGQIINRLNEDYYEVEILTIKNKINSYVNYNDIEYWSENKKDVEKYFKIKKYNI